MSFFRPEIVAGARRWRETLSGVILVVIAIWLMTEGIGGRFWIGVLIAAFGLGLIVTGVPRARTRTAGGAPGIVEVVERRLTYFGPLSGGAMALEDIARIAADPDRRWVLTSVEGELMTIPMDAEGSDTLFDAFAALPGLSAHRLAAAMQGYVPARRVIWEKESDASG